jgi:hypothetical protein
MLMSLKVLNKQVYTVAKRGNVAYIYTKKYTNLYLSTAYIYLKSIQIYILVLCIV